MTAIHIAAALLVVCSAVSGGSNNRLSVSRGDRALDLTLSSRYGESSLLKATIGRSLGPKAFNCSADEEICFKWENAELRISLVDDVCRHMSWTSTNATGRFEDCFDLGQDHWFGGPERTTQYWPFEKQIFNENSYITKLDHYQALADPYWVNSKGVYIIVDEDVPLFVDQKNLEKNGMCLIAKNSDPYPTENQVLKLSYKVCTLENARKAHEHAINTYIGKPTGIPDERMLRYPVYSTWAKYKKNINEDSVREYANNILKNGFNNSQLEIDEMWETCFGSAQFDTKKFPDAKKLVADLKALGFRVTLWKAPFINTNCPYYYSQAAAKGYLAKNQMGSVETNWWEGRGGLVDFTNPEAATWYAEVLNGIKATYGIDSFKFDAGESSYLPQPPELNTSLSLVPNVFTNRYVETVSQFGGMVEVRSARRTQKLPIFLRMLDKDSRWGFDNGLSTLITTLLVMSMQGYPFVLPDMVGGNVYGSDKLSGELLVRWMQANTFMPAVQFSYPPWEFDKQTVAIIKKYTALHYEYSDLIIQLARNASQYGTPINPPIWWLDPEDSEAQAVDDEFLLGEEILVAPVLVQGATSRDVYLPQGSWREGLHPANKLIQGRAWLRNYTAALDELPYFIRQQ
ncbi:myogenesis-regulating glycosidase-like isoform X2 [Bacillus rossius redtenbacheri]|uniref:myogenesis-regulating glycosidase-like isoform X2 n=2 Tax=Bacillus rossius redtenbacheri TaxID=93214 RepID=UPI002FDDBDF4